MSNVCVESHVPSLQCVQLCPVAASLLRSTQKVSHLSNSISVKLIQAACAVTLTSLCLAWPCARIQQGMISCRLLGEVLGWASSLFYLGSRVSQICKNISRRSAEGLSLAMFGCAIIANITYGLGILLRTYTWHNLRSSLPWILGSLGTVALDFCIFAQVMH